MKVMPVGEYLPAFILVSLMILGFAAAIVFYATKPSTQSTTSIPGGASKIYGPSQEAQNVSAVYQNYTPLIFNCNTDSDCVKVHDTQCFNNLASQQACINRAYAQSYNSSYQSYTSSKPVVCAQYYVSASSTCACIKSSCNLVYTQS